MNIPGGDSPALKDGASAGLVSKDGDMGVSHQGHAVNTQQQHKMVGDERAAGTQQVWLHAREMVPNHAKQLCHPAPSGSLLPASPIQLAA